MSDDLSKKIKQITDLLSQENMPENLKGLLSLLAGPGGKEETQTKPVDPPALTENNQNKSEVDDNVEMMRKIKKVMDRLNTNNDPRINLLNAIKPYLNTRRQKKLDSCIRLLQVTSLAKLMEESDKSN